MASPPCFVLSRILLKANRLAYDFVTRVTNSEFYLQQANASFCIVNNHRF